MRTKFIITLAAVAALAGAGSVTAPAQAEKDLGIPKVRVGEDNCGNFNVWINGQPLFHYVMCGPPPA